jgi:hypothetical protein
MNLIKYFINNTLTNIIQKRKKKNVSLVDRRGGFIKEDGNIYIYIKEMNIRASWMKMKYMLYSTSFLDS